MSWKQLLRHNFTNVKELAHFLELPLDAFDPHPKFILNLPKRLAEKIEKGNIHDPLLRQFVPLKAEQEKAPGFVIDPVSDTRFRKSQKMLQKYEGRALIVSTSACAMHCRYCFRKNFPYERESSFENELTLLRHNRSLDEVILSGGDPLSLPNEKLKILLDAINDIDHIKRIRFHTRFLIGIPERIDESFLDVLRSVKKQIIFVIHANHIHEFDDAVWNSIQKIQKEGIPVLCQSILLRGVNDSVDALKEFFEGLINHGVIPYYLHQLDRVEGAHHFEVAPEDGMRFIAEVRKRLPGYAIPEYVVEVPGEPSKTPILG